jgi:hypothetical protein
VSFVCTFCQAPLPESPPGVLVRCASCGGVTPSPAVASLAATVPIIPPTVAAMPSANAPSSVFGPSIKGAASPPPANPGQSTAGGVDEIIGAGALLFGLVTAKSLLLFIISSLMLSCAIGMITLLFAH